MSTEVVTKEEDALYVAHDAAIRQGRDIVNEVVNSLRIMHAQRLYRKYFATFEDYVHDALGWSRAKAYRALELSAKEPQNVSHGETNSTQINTEPPAEDVAENATTETESVPEVRGELTYDEPNAQEIDHEETSRPQQPTAFESADELDDRDECTDHMRGAVDELISRGFGRQKILDACYAAASYTKENT